MKKKQGMPKYVVMVKTIRSKNYVSFGFDSKSNAIGYRDECRKHFCDAHLFVLVKK